MSGPLPPSSSLQLLTLADVAELFKVSEDTVYRLIARCELESVRVGARRRVRVSAAQAYLERQQAPS